MLTFGIVQASLTLLSLNRIFQLSTCLKFLAALRAELVGLPHLRVTSWTAVVAHGFVRRVDE